MELGGDLVGRLIDKLDGDLRRELCGVLIGNLVGYLVHDLLIGEALHGVGGYIELVQILDEHAIMG